MMSPAQKQKIEDLRRMGLGYGAVAKQLNLPVANIKTFCWRNKLDSRLTQKAPVINDRKKSGKPCRKRDKSDISCEVIVSYSENPSAAAVTDVMQVLICLQGR